MCGTNIKEIRQLQSAIGVAMREIFLLFAAFFFNRKGLLIHVEDEENGNYRSQKENTKKEGKRREEVR